jgi:hypothetical protein
LDVEMMNDQQVSIYHSVPGGSDLLSWFGQVPSFHDAEILSLYLCRRGQSILRLHGWIMGKIGHDGYLMLDKHAVVTFMLEGVMDLQLDGFSSQNVIGGLTLRHAPDRADRRPYLTLTPLPEDIEIQIEPCFGMVGLIRARSVAISFESGKPND